MYYYCIGYVDIDAVVELTLAHKTKFSRKEFMSIVNEAKTAIHDELKKRIRDSELMFLPCDYFIFDDCNIKKWLCENKGFVEQSPFTACYILT